MIKKIILILFFIFTSSIARADSDLLQQLPIADGVSIFLPKDWVEIPQEAIEATKAKLAQMNPHGGAASFDFDYGFQPKYSSRWLTYPYMLVKIRNSGRIPEAQIVKLKNIKSDMEKSAEQVNNTLSNSLISSKVGEVLYDPDNHILWSYISIDVSDVGNIKIISALILTEHGAVNVVGYAKGADFSDYLPLFQSIARQVSIPKDLKYNSQMLDSIQSILKINWGMVVIIGFIVAAIIVGLLMFILLREAKSGAGLKKAAKLKIRPLLKDAFNTLIKYPGLFILGAIAQLPTLLIGTKIDLRLLLVIIVSFLVGSYCVGLIIRFIYESRIGLLSLSGINKFVLKKYLALLMLYFLVYLITAAGLVLLFIPGIFIIVRLSLSDYGILLEEDRIIPSIKRSWEITKGNWWRISFVCLIVPLPLYILIPFSSLIPKSIYTLCFFLLGSLVFVWSQALYFHIYMALRKS